MNIWSHFARHAKREYSARARGATIACASLIFVFGIPAFLFWLSGIGGEDWHFRLSPGVMVSCLLLGAMGLSFALWTVWTQFKHARGTPVPIMATKKLLTGGPYSCCRNPMALGTLVFYAGIAAFTQSFIAVWAVLLFALVLVTYIKLIEENEVSIRFGDEYSQYKQSTPFMIPRFPFFRMPIEEDVPSTGGFEVRSSCPILRMLDEAEGRAFYVDYLGFGVDWECRFTPDAPVFMQVRLGEACIHLDGHATEDSPSCQVNIPVLGLQNYRDFLIAKGADYPRPCIEDVRYVGRPTDMNIEDPFGNLLIFSSQTTEG